jgi:hypothetical protein
MTDEIKTIKLTAFEADSAELMKRLKEYAEKYSNSEDGYISCAVFLKSCTGSIWTNINNTIKLPDYFSVDNRSGVYADLFPEWNKKAIADEP